MKNASVALAILLTAVIAGCAEPPSEVTAPSTNYTVLPLNSVYFVVSPGASVPPAALPYVHVHSESGPAAGVLVTFTRAGSGAPTTYSVATDEDGNARLDSWQVGSASGEYNTTATSPGGSSLAFTAFVRARAVAEYDLSEPIPSERLSVGTVHYVLFDDGTYIYYLGAVPNNELARSPSGKYQFVNSATVKFSRGFPWSDVFSTGTISGSKMRVTYWDSIDYEDEVYGRRN